MAVLSAVILKSKEIKGGKNKVRIAVAHNGETRYIVTDIIINSPKEFKNGSIVKRPDATMLNVKIRSLLQRYQAALDELEYIDGLSCPELVYQLKTAGCKKNRTLKSLYEEYIENANIKTSSITFYRALWNTISSNLGENLIVEHIHHGTILGLEKYLGKRGSSLSTIHNSMCFLKTIINYGKKCGYVKMNFNPFLGFAIPDIEVRDAWLTVDEVRRIRDLDVQKRSLVKCRDLFMLSYYLGGINMIDLLDINFNEQREEIHYIRKKTERRPKLNKFVEFKIPEEAKPIIEKWKGADGRLAVTKNQYKTNLCCFFQQNLKRIAALAGIKRLIYYSARKSFSQHAFNLGVKTSVIDYILGHRVDKGGSSLFNYIYVTPKIASEAVRLVLDNLKNNC